MHTRLQVVAMRCVQILTTCAALGASISPAQEPARYIDPSGSEGTSAAVVVPDVPLIHTAQFLAQDGDSQVDFKDRLDLQLEAVLNSLDAALVADGTALAKVVKINVVAADAEVAREVRQALALKFSQSGESKPAVSYVTGKLRHPDALVAMDAVAMGPAAEKNAVTRTRIAPRQAKKRLAHAATLPAGPKVYVSGQAEKGQDLPEMTRRTLESLAATLKHLGLGLGDVVQVKSFFGPVTGVDEVEHEIVDFFKGEPLVPPLVYVEWTPAPSIEIELVASATSIRDKPAAAVEFITPPGMTASPVFSRVARMAAGPTIYFSGLYGTSGEAGDPEIVEIFEQLGELLDRTDSDIRHLVKATYYVTTDESSKRLNERRLKIYDPQRPPAASKAPVTGVGRKEKTITIDMIAAPRTK